MSLEKKSPLHIGLAQMTSSDDWLENRHWVLERVSNFSDENAVDLYFFPENSLYLRLDRRAKMQSRSVDDVYFDSLSELSSRTGATLYFGSVPLRFDDGVFNSALILTPDGQRLTPYQKIHLFDIHLEGQEALRESQDFRHGVRPSIWNFKGWSWGLSICYDLRFAELFHQYALAGVDVIGVPSAFLVPTGQAHWHVLLRARAIESQAFVLAPAQGGQHGGQRETFGHSLAVDPWGTVLLDAAHSGVHMVSLDPEQLQQVRRQIPMAAHRKLGKA